MFTPGELDHAVVDPDTVLDALMAPVWCPRIFEDSPPAGDPEREVFVQAWLLHEVGAIGDKDFTGMAGGLGTHSRHEQVETVRNYFTDNLGCRDLG